MTAPALASLHVYPVKSCRGIDVARWPLDRYGLAHDRSFLVVDPSGRFRTQRELPRLALVETRLTETELVLRAPGHGELRLPLARTEGPRIGVEVWRHRGPALLESDEASAFLSGFLGAESRLVRLPPEHVRRVNPERFPGEAHTAWSDGYPLLVISEASLEELNRRLPKRLPMERFRPNLVVRGCGPFAEDGWRRIRVGAIELALVKPCDRCVVTTTDPRTGERDGKEPLRTLATFRTGEAGVLFGQNAVHLSQGVLEVGTAIEVLETGPPVETGASR